MEWWMHVCDYCFTDIRRKAGACKTQGRAALCVLAGGHLASVLVLISFFCHRSRAAAVSTKNSVEPLAPWPAAVALSRKRRSVAAFREALAFPAIQELPCAVCSRKRFKADTENIKIDNSDFVPLLARVLRSTANGPLPGDRHTGLGC
jgi:hypothetical protein